MKYKDYLIKNTDSQRIFKFENGYGASVICNDISYGHEQGLFELAVLKFAKEGKKFVLCYDTEITDDVIGYLTLEDVEAILEKIKNLKEVENV